MQNETIRLSVCDWQKVGLWFITHLKKFSNRLPIVAEDLSVETLLLEVCLQLLVWDRTMGIIVLKFCDSIESHRSDVDFN